MAGANKQEWPPLLPAGFHDLDLIARRRLCVDRFPDSITRPRILKHLEAAIVQINAQHISGHIWVDGSFLTEKLNPDDADIALVISRSTFLSMTGSQLQFFHQFRSTSLYEQYRIDNYGLVFDPSDAADEWNYAYWLKQFGFSRKDEMKGILRVTVPFLVKP